jgi:hypothetical protein
MGLAQSVWAVRPPPLGVWEYNEKTLATIPAQNDVENRPPQLGRRSLCGNLLYHPLSLPIPIHPHPSPATHALLAWTRFISSTISRLSEARLTQLAHPSHRHANALTGRAIAFWPHRCKPNPHHQLTTPLLRPSTSIVAVFLCTRI